MNTMPDDSSQIPPEESIAEAEVAPKEEKRNLKMIGGMFLALVFIASASATVAFLASAPSGTGGAQTAAAAEALPDPFADVVLDAKAVYVEDLATGKVLYQVHPSAQLPLASLTKIPLALAVSEALPPDTTITLSHDLLAPSTGEKLVAGGSWRLGDVLDFTLTASSNDGADFLAEEANDAVHARYPRSPGAGATLWRMNDLVQSLGLTSMYFLNTSGLDMSPTQASAFGSARDVAKLLAYAASTDPGVFEATTRRILTLTSLGGMSVTATNTDSALSSIPGLVMGKTGYTDLAGGNLAILFEAGPARPVAVVVLGSTYDGRFEDIETLVDAAQAAIAQGE